VMGTFTRLNVLRTKTGKIVAGIDGCSRTMTSKLHAQLSSDVVHFWEHSPYAQRAKSRYQNSVCFAPIGLILECREEAIVNTLSNLL
jgi:hypothetical protein